MGERVVAMPEYCTIEAEMEVGAGKWKLAILKHLFADTQWFGELNRTCRALHCGC